MGRIFPAEKNCPPEIRLRSDHLNGKRGVLTYVSDDMCLSTVNVPYRAPKGLFSSWR